MGGAVTLLGMSAARTMCAARFPAPFAMAFAGCSGGNVAALVLPAARAARLLRPRILLRGARGNAALRSGRVRVVDAVVLQDEVERPRLYVGARDDDGHRIPEAAEHSSARERIAIEAERETTDMKKIEYMAQFVGETYEGVISGVTAFGIFVELENGVEGLVHVSTMINDYYTYVEDQYAMVGERTGTRYRLGDTVTIIITRADVQARTLDFVLKDNGVYDPNAAAPAKRGTAPPHAKKDAGTEQTRSPHRRKGERRDTPAAAVGESHGERRRKTRGAHGTSGRHAQKGDRAAHAAAESVPRKARTDGKPASRRSERGGKPNADRPPRGGRSRSESRRDDERTTGRDYHRVKVTGLNSAVWPDPPGYRSRSEEPERTEKPRRAPRPARRMNRKTEGGTRGTE